MTGGCSNGGQDRRWRDVGVSRGFVLVEAGRGHEASVPCRKPAAISPVRFRRDDRMMRDLLRKRLPKARLRTSFAANAKGFDAIP
jgi:hypothetical protein